MKVEVRNLKKHFGSTKAVDDVSFEFHSGETFGFVGPNGSGKTTTMRIMATMEEPTDGDVLIDGVSVVEYPEHARRLLGYVPDNEPTPPDINIHEYLDFYARAYGIKGARREKTVKDIEEFTNTVGIREKMVKSLSKGMKQRVSVARALLHDPALILMDEPAAGLDPRARIDLRELVKALADTGKAILISSHILPELAEMCNGTVIIEKGVVLRAGKLDTIMDQDAKDQPHRRYLVRVLGDDAELARLLLETPGVHHAVALGKGQVSVDVLGGEEEACALLAALVGKGVKIAEFKPEKHSLENIFMNATKGTVQ
jgi:ABC-2 type transport system ATP-binding protein